MVPSSPPRVTIIAKSGVNPLQKTTEVLQVLPKQSITKFELAPKKSVYQDGGRVTARLHLRWDQPATMPWISVCPSISWAEAIGMLAAAGSKTFSPIRGGQI